jgi:hypothetical protein
VLALEDISYRLNATKFIKREATTRKKEREERIQAFQEELKGDDAEPAGEADARRADDLDRGTSVYASGVSPACYSLHRLGEDQGRKEVAGWAFLLARRGATAQEPESGLLGAETPEVRRLGTDDLSDPADFSRCGRP